MSYLVTKADLDKNKADILALWDRNFSNSLQERYAWIYERNPFGLASCWLVKEMNGGKVVGSTTLFPKRMRVEGQLRVAGLAGDFAVDRDHRGFGPALSLQRAAVSSCGEFPFDFLYGMPTKQAEPVIRRVGYKVIGHAVRMTKVLKTDNYLKRMGLPGPAKIVSKPIDLTMKLLSKENYFKSISDFSLDVITHFDRRFDALWEKVSGNYSVIGERRSDYLNWRFAHCPHNKYSLWGFSRLSTGERLGYLVACVAQRKVHIVDLLVCDLGDVFDVFLSEFIRLQREEVIEAISISYFGNHVLVDKLKGFGFSIRGAEATILAYVPPNSPFSSSLLEKENWYLMPGDNDI